MAAGRSSPSPELCGLRAVSAGADAPRLGLRVPPEAARGRAPVPGSRSDVRPNAPNRPNTPYWIGGPVLSFRLARAGNGAPSLYCSSRRCTSRRQAVWQSSESVAGASASAPGMRCRATTALRSRSMSQCGA